MHQDSRTMPMRHLLRLLFLAAAAALLPPSRGHNITRILAEHPDFSSFNHYLTATHLAAEINRRETLTVLALDNAAMASVLAKHLPLQTLKHLLSLHVLVDYFGAKKLHQITSGTALISTVFQSTGSAPGTSGFVNITDHRAGHVTFSASGSDSHSSFVKSIKEIPYNISVVQISSPLSSPAAEAPTPPPSSIPFLSLMSSKGCKTFADQLTAGKGEVAKAFKGSVESGLTVFCPIDQAMDAFMPKFNNLTDAQKKSVLLYHALPSYNSIDMLLSKDGIFATLATTSAKLKDFNLTVLNAGEAVSLRTRVTTAKISGTLVDADPLAVYTIDEVLEPSELFKPAKRAAAPAPAPAPDAADADAPAPSVAKKKAKAKKKEKKPAPEMAPAPAGPESEPSDEEAADVSAGRRSVYVRREVVGAAAAAAAVAALMMLA